MAKLNANKLGLVLGLFFALWHLIWAVIVSIGAGQQLIDWVLPLHFIDVITTITDFNLANAAILVALAFVGGYIIGWVFAWIWNLVNKK